MHWKTSFSSYVQTHHSAEHDLLELLNYWQKNESTTFWIRSLDNLLSRVENFQYAMNPDVWTLNPDTFYPVTYKIERTFDYRKYSRGAERNVVAFFTSWTSSVSSLDSLRSKRFPLEQRKNDFGPARNETRAKKWKRGEREGKGGNLPFFPTPSPLFYLHYFSRSLWLSFLVLCF